MSPHVTLVSFKLIYVWVSPEKKSGEAEEEAVMKIGGEFPISCCMTNPILSRLAPFSKLLDQVVRRLLSYHIVRYAILLSTLSQNILF